MKRTWKETAARLLILLLGLCIAHLGVVMFLLSELGSDPFNVMVQGICRSLNSAFSWDLSHGSIHRAMCFLIMVILLLTDRHYVRIGTLVCMFFGGSIIDFYTSVLGRLLNAQSPLAVRFIMLAAGCIVLACGMTIVINSDAGTGPDDLVALVISDKLHVKFGYVRICTDSVLVLTGWLLGGTVGAGTLVCICLVGPAANFFLPRNGKWITALLNRLQARFWPPETGEAEP